VRLSALVLIALGALRVNAMRSALAMLGIIIGVAAVVTMVAIGAGAQDRVTAQIESLGTNLIIVLNGSGKSGGARLGTGSAPRLTDGDARALESEVAGIEAAAPTLRGNGQLVAGNLNWSAPTQGTTPGYLVARDWDITAGRGFSDDEVRRAAKVVVIGQTVAENLFVDTDPIGASVRLKKVPFTVIGVLARKGQNSYGQDQDDVAMIPLSTSRKRVIGAYRGQPYAVAVILVKVFSADLMAETEKEIAELLRQRHRIRPGQPDDFVVRNLSELMGAREAASRILSILLAALASVSLVVGGIGIMNIMLVSVTERTREIGLRMAVGARQRDILRQFLVEAATLSLIGGLIGVALGLAGSGAIAKLAGWPALVQPSALALAFAFAGAVGVFFGYYPAHKAARLNPIEALRYE
jgi:putative ABC transport system permease protein